MAEPINIVIVGHTNAGKTSLLRTLARKVDFGEVSDRPGTTRHAEVVDLRLGATVAVRFVDTPGIEDSVALLDFLGRMQGASRLERVHAFLRGPEAREAFEQEAKVLRALIERADAAMLVIDTREPALPKFRAEIEALTWCAKPIMPVLNFVRDASSRQAEWHQALKEANLHARVEFDVVAPFSGAEQRLYNDLSTLLPARRAQLGSIIEALQREAHERCQAACRTIAGTLIDVAAMRRALPAEEFAEAQRQASFVQAFRDDVSCHARRAVEDLLAVFTFRPDDAELTDMPELVGRWEDDLFNPELLMHAGKKLGMGTMIGAGIGAVADVALAGLSLGAATTLGGALGGAASGGWRPLWRKLENRLKGVQELTVEDPVLLLLADHLLDLARALAHRGHAAQTRLRVSGKDSSTEEALRAIPGQLDPARGHPDWERTLTSSVLTPWAYAGFSEGRLRLEATIAQQLERCFAALPAA